MRENFLFLPILPRPLALHVFVSLFFLLSLLPRTILLPLLLSLWGQPTFSSLATETYGR